MVLSQSLKEWERRLYAVNGWVQVRLIILFIWLTEQI